MKKSVVLVSMPRLYAKNTCHKLLSQPNVQNANVHCQKGEKNEIPSFLADIINRLREARRY